MLKYRSSCLYKPLHTPFLPSVVKEEEEEEIFIEIDFPIIEQPAVRSSTPKSTYQQHHQESRHFRRYSSMVVSAFKLSVW